MPGPPPLHRPTFPDEFLAEARRLFHARTAASHLRQRARLALLLHEFPALSNVAAAARFLIMRQILEHLSIPVRTNGDGFSIRKIQTLKEESAIY